MARPKKKPDPAQTELEDAISAKVEVFLVDPGWTADLLIKRELELDDYVSSQINAFAGFCKPYQEEMQAIRSRLLEMHLEQKTDQFKTDYGTSYVSEIMNQKVDEAALTYLDTETGEVHSGREALMYYMLDNWDKYGNEALKVSVDIKTVRQVMQDTATPENPNGNPPPGITVSYFRRVNINRG